MNKAPTELQSVERPVSMKKVITQSLWTFELGTQKRINVPIWIFVGFQERDRQDSQNMDNDTFYRLAVQQVPNVLFQRKNILILVH